MIVVNQSEIFSLLRDQVSSLISDRFYCPICASLRGGLQSVPDVFDFLIMLLQIFCRGHMNRWFDDKVSTIEYLVSGLFLDSYRMYYHTVDRADWFLTHRSCFRCFLPLLAHMWPRLQDDEVVSFYSDFSFILVCDSYHCIQIDRSLQYQLVIPFSLLRLDLLFADWNLYWRYSFE